ncbi:MAG: DUF167 domain-containing protein [Candidatus Eisenbacteria bacterium]
MSAQLAVRVQPGARRNALTGRLASGEWKLAVTAPPEDGRANDAVVELLAQLLDLKRRQVTVARGASSRSKTIAVEGLSAADAEARLAAELERTNEAHGQ